ncbi:DUF262 domain-containing protein [Edaphobacter sp.]|uniref:DUF262 domain-containing protein n=1 Tax=Edaphobacter sp. TaxID=1934404 RepID=UPI002DB92AF6|nr:DUF262 domain-containing protein [Edaphobacter sp.]HEU5341259.1 DUF262 domain-containing protein [Edaphobacter sp.]
MQEIDTWDIDKTEESEEDEQDLQAFRISYYPADLTLRGYLDKWNAKQLIIPKFQRSYVWDQVKASKLIESFLLGLPVPGVFLYKERNTNKLQVVDGQQRILTAVRFFANEFDEKIFRLKGVLPKWNGKTYQELPESDRLQLDDTVLRATVIQQLDPEDDSSIFHIFERLNTGGINLNPMEIRKCVYSGVFFDLLDALNSAPEWRKLIGQPKLDKRIRDSELLLRVLALSREWSTYQKPMKRFLSSFLAKANKRFKVEGDPALRAEQTKWTETLHFALAQLGEKPFHLRGRLNYAALDSTLIAAHLAQDRNVTNFGERYAELIRQEDYLHWVTQDTSDDKVIKSRIGKAISWLSE